jgi:hypothetical protein
MAAFIAIAGAPPASGATLTVGATKTYPVPSAAAAAAQDGDTIEIDAGTYANDGATWHANNLTIRGVGSGYAHLASSGSTGTVMGKAIWVIQGSNTTIENIEFSGAKVTDNNGAGIRQEGLGLTLRNCWFHDNQEGILTGDGGDILIEGSTFGNNGAGDGYSHNMYIGHVQSFTLRASWTHDAVVGHTVKSRAFKNVIEYNRITSEQGGSTSYELDFPNGGETYVIGNVIEQGVNTQNPTILTFAEEGATNPTQALYVVNNTFVNDLASGTFVRNQSAGQALIQNNIFVGPGTIQSGPAMSTSNLMPPADPLLVSRAGFDYHLASAASPAIGAGTDPGTIGAMKLAPDSEYVQPASSEPRPRGFADQGAFQYPAPGPGTDAGTVAMDAGANDSGGAALDAGHAAMDAASPDASAPPADGGMPLADGGSPGPGPLAASNGCKCSANGGHGSWLIPTCVLFGLVLRPGRRRVGGHTLARRRGS